MSFSVIGGFAALIEHWLMQNRKKKQRHPAKKFSGLHGLSVPSSPT